MTLAEVAEERLADGLVTGRGCWGAHGDLRQRTAALRTGERFCRRIERSIQQRASRDVRRMGLPPGLQLIQPTRQAVLGPLPVEKRATLEKRKSRRLQAIWGFLSLR
jgi:hypothetical protein